MIQLDKTDGIWDKNGLNLEHKWNLFGQNELFPIKISVCLDTNLSEF